MSPLAVATPSGRLECSMLPLAAPAGEVGTRSVESSAPHVVAALRQTSGSCCAFNALSNVCAWMGRPVPDSVFSRWLRAAPSDGGRFSPLTEAVIVLARSSSSFVRTPAVLRHSDLHDWVDKATHGVYVVACEGHCFTINAATREFLDTDPANPVTVPYSRDMFVAFGLGHYCTGLYEVKLVSSKKRSVKRALGEL